jgi:hypothetical protein
LHLASGDAGGLPAVLKACREQVAAEPFLEMAREGRAGELWPVGRVQEFWRWAFPERENEVRLGAWGQGADMGAQGRCAGVQQGCSRGTVQ